MWPSESEEKAWLLTSIQQRRRATGPLGLGGLQWGWTTRTWKIRMGCLRSKEALTLAVGPGITLARQGARRSSQSLLAPKAGPGLLCGLLPKRPGPQGSLSPVPREAHGTSQKERPVLSEHRARRKDAVWDQRGMPAARSEAGRAHRACHPSLARSDTGPASSEERRGLTTPQLGHHVKKCRCRTGRQGNNQIPNCSSSPLKTHAHSYKAAPGWVGLIPTSTPGDWCPHLQKQARTRKCLGPGGTAIQLWLRLGCTPLGLVSPLDPPLLGHTVAHGLLLLQGSHGEAQVLLQLLNLPL